MASQPTRSRFEHAVSPRALYRMGRMVASPVIAQHRHRLKSHAQRITIDLDPTDDPTHGQQELACCNGHDDTWCYLPLVATLTCNDEADSIGLPSSCGPGTVRRSGAPPASCAACAGRSRRRRCAFVWMGASRETTGWTSWKRSESSLSWGSPAPRGWSGTRGVCWVRPTACRRTAATRRTSRGRPSLRPRVGRIAVA